MPLFCCDSLAAPVAFIMLFFGGLALNADDRWACCIAKSEQLVTFDATNPEEVKAFMRTRYEVGDLLGSVYCPTCERLDPNPLEGVWWMDGNIAPEELGTMADAYYRNPEEKNTIRRMYQAIIAVEGGTWAYPAIPWGRTLFINNCVANDRNAFIIDETREKLLNQGPEPNDPATAMTYMTKDHYNKKIPNLNAEYNLRRIIDENGQTTEHWDLWMNYLQWNPNSRRLYTYRRSLDSNPSDLCLDVTIPN